MACTQDGTTALIAATREDQRAAIKVLLARGADPCRRNRDGKDAVGVAEDKVMVEALSLLLQASVSQAADQALADSEERQQDARRQMDEATQVARQEMQQAAAVSTAEKEKRVGELKAETDELLQRLGIKR